MMSVFVSALNYNLTIKIIKNLTLFLKNKKDYGIIIKEMYIFINLL